MLQGEHSAQGHFEVGHEQGGGTVVQPDQLLSCLVSAVHRVIAVTDIFFGGRDAGFFQGVQITGETLVGGIQLRTAKYQTDPAVAEIRQLPDGLARGMDVVDDHGAGFSAKALDQPVDEQHGDPGGKRHFQMGAGGIGGHVDQAVHPAVHQEFNGFLFPFCVAPAVTDDDCVIMLAQDVLHRGDDGCDEGVAELGNDHADDTRLLGFQTAGHIVGHVTQLFDCRFDQQPVFFTDRSAVEVFGERCQPQSRFPGQILQCRGHRITSVFLLLSYQRLNEKTNTFLLPKGKPKRKQRKTKRKNR